MERRRGPQTDRGGPLTAAPGLRSARDRPHETGQGRKTLRVDDLNNTGARTGRSNMVICCPAQTPFWESAADDDTGVDQSQTGWTDSARLLSPSVRKAPGAVLGER